MFRLALNVSATRLVLEHGYAGAVIESFGSFVVGDSVIVGLVVFLILIVIQFVVVTAGSGRVAEVAARFTLDGMPGKQMAIDADLNSGSINEAEAKAPPGRDLQRSRLLRGHGRGVQVRPGRRHRRHRHHADQPDRRVRRRHPPAAPHAQPGHPHLQPAQRRRRPGLADPRPPALDLDRHHGHPGQPPRTTSGPTCWLSCAASTTPCGWPAS